jgi:hypothetical protein
MPQPPLPPVRLGPDARQRGLDLHLHARDQVAVGVDQYLLGVDLGDNGLWLSSRALRLLVRLC